MILIYGPLIMRMVSVESNWNYGVVIVILHFIQSPIDFFNQTAPPYALQRNSGVLLPTPQMQNNFIALIIYLSSC